MRGKGAEMLAFKIIYCALGLWAVVNLVATRSNQNRILWTVVIIGVILPLVIIWKS